MRTPVPTALVEVEVADAPRRGVPKVVLTPGADLGETKRDSSGDGGDTWECGVGTGDPLTWRTAGAKLVRALNEANAAQSYDVVLPPDTDAERIRALVLGLALGGYRFKVTAETPPPRIRSVRLVAADPGYADVLAAEAARAYDSALATAFSRDLANMPSNVKDPQWLASTAAKAAGKIPGLHAVVRDEKWLTEQGFGGVLAVGGGSTRGPRLLELSWQPRAVAGQAPHVVLIGKGITFDTGGISIKPADGMHLMRTDMSGGAAVISAMLSIARRGLPVRVTGLVPCAENHVSGSAYRPGDIVRHYGGTTTEITNTDAEGRIVLADALAYAVKTLNPDVLVDVATLTGAMKVSLGLRTGGLFATSDDLATRVTAAGRKAGENWWRMPLLEDHADAVKSDVADVRQCPPGPGGITAALFLKTFTANLPWAHLDIAGPARSESEYDEVVPGATGFAARTLIDLVDSYTH